MRPRTSRRGGRKRKVPGTQTLYSPLTTDNNVESIVTPRNIPRKKDRQVIVMLKALRIPDGNVDNGGALDP